MERPVAASENACGFKWSQPRSTPPDTACRSSLLEKVESALVIVIAGIDGRLAAFQVGDPRRCH